MTSGPIMAIISVTVAAIDEGKLVLQSTVNPLQCATATTTPRTPSV